VQPVLGGRDDAGLPRAVEGVRRQRPRDRSGLRCGEPPGGEGAGDTGSGGATAEQAPAADPRGAVAVGRGQDVTAAVSFDSGSESALTESESALTSSAESSV
jgi:hypothetical protein